MRRLAMIVLAALSSTAGQAACRSIPAAETPALMLRAFQERMARTGVGPWRFATDMGGGTMYYARSTDLNLVIKSGGSLVDEAGLLLSTPTPEDEVRLEAAAAFLASRFSGAPEADLQPRVAKAIAAVRKDREARTVREGEASLVISAPDARAIAIKGGRVRCD